MSTGLEFAVLGPLEVRRDGEPLAITAAKHRIVLATLLVRANEVVHTDVLAERLWAEHPPAGARKTVQGYVARLRRMLGRDVIGTRAPGYVLAVPPGSLDLRRFDELVTRARNLAGDHDERSALLTSALALWRGAPLADVPSETLQAIDAARLAEARIEVLGRRIDADLHRGRHTEVISELRELVTTHPYDEGFAGQLMTALYRAGRRVDALAVYRRTRNLLTGEMGVEPGPPLQALHRTILTAQEPAPPVSPGPVRPAAHEPARPVTREAAAPVVLAPTPAQMPAALIDLVGREKESGVVRDGITGGTGVVTCVSGPGGVGKTAVAVHAAHQERDAFPDGQLYVGLHGRHDDPLDPFDVLGRFLGALGVPAAAQPSTLEERGGCFRSLTAGRRMLVLLDDAAGEAQIRPLLPGGPHAATIVTSRRMPAGLDNARHVELEPLSAGDAVEMLGRIAGHDRVSREIDAAYEIAGRCGHLPLAVRIAGVRLLARPHHGLSWLAGRLGDDRRRLAELAAGDQQMRASIAASYRRLDTGARRVVRRLSRAEPRTFSVAAARAVAGLGADAAQEVLDTLVEHRMLETTTLPEGVGYRLNELVRLFARDAGGEPDQTGNRC